MICMFLVLGIKRGRKGINVFRFLFCFLTLENLFNAMRTETSVFDRKKKLEPLKCVREQEYKNG